MQLQSLLLSIIFNMLVCVYIYIYSFAFEQLKIENPLPENLELHQDISDKHVSQIKTFSWELKETTLVKNTTYLLLMLNTIKYMYIYSTTT